MPFIPVPDTAEVDIRATLNGEKVETTLYYLQTGGITSTLLDLLTAAIATDLATNGWLGQQSSAYIIVEVYARDLSVAIGAQSTDVSQAGAGGFLGNVITNNVTLAVSRLSGLTGRSSRGRVFIPGISRDGLTDVNHVLSTYAADFVAALESFDAVATALGWTPVIVSRQNAGVVLTTGVTYPITQWAVSDLTVDSQRRRLPGRGT